MADLLGDVMLTVLAGDLLYLYHAGAWSDPHRAILAGELVVLYLLGAFGLFRAGYHAGRFLEGGY